MGRGEAASLTTASIYSDISNSTFNQIKNIDLEGSFGTKIDTSGSPVYVDAVHADILDSCTPSVVDKRE